MNTMNVWRRRNRTMEKENHGLPESSYGFKRQVKFEKRVEEEEGRGGYRWDALDDCVARAEIGGCQGKRRRRHS